MLERPLAINANYPVRVNVLKEGDVFVAYINDQVALTARCYMPFSGSWGVFVSEGEAAFTDTYLTRAK